VIRHSLLCCALVAGLAHAQVAATCDQPRAIDKYQLLRRLSLDLRGHIPTWEEYQALDAQGGVPDALISQWLSGDDFRVVMRRYHEDLFWPNLSAVALNNVNSTVSLVATATAPKPDATFAIASAGKRKQLRGLSDVETTVDGAQCGDFEQTHFLPGGAFVPDPAFVHTATVNGTAVKQEGWRLVTPYWAPTTQIKVCAYDAMETASVTVNGNAVACNTPAGDGRAECGCGPNLRFCYGGTVRTIVQAAFREQVGQLVDQVSVGGKPYTTLVTTRSVPVNGPLAFWKKYLGPHLSTSRVWSEPDPGEPLPERDFTDTTWSTVDRGNDLHAGVLTTPAYLLRFQTNRGRANRYRIDFECEAFTPPSQLENASNGCAESGTDLSGRCTCRYCHNILEPLAAHWGQFAEAGTSLLSDTAAWPRTKSTCVNSTSGVCNRFYVTSSDGDKPGAFLPYQYADAAHPGITAGLAAGPKGRVTEGLANGAFAKCAVKRAWSYLMKRDMRVAGETTDELSTLNTLSSGFASNNYSLPWLFQSIVSQPDYRRTR
jgi:hypothetical protein